eukprot:2247003-Amphidinium_carterae.1
MARPAQRRAPRQGAATSSFSVPKRSGVPEAKLEVSHQSCVERRLCARKPNSQLEIKPQTCAFTLPLAGSRRCGHSWCDQTSNGVANPWKLPRCLVLGAILPPILPRK